MIARDGLDARITHAYGICAAPGGLTTGMVPPAGDHPAGSMRQLVDSVDAILVIAADNSAWHE